MAALKQSFFLLCTLLCAMACAEDPPPPDCDVSEELHYDYYSDTYSCIPRRIPTPTSPRESSCDPAKEYNCTCSNGRRGVMYCSGNTVGPCQCSGPITQPPACDVPPPISLRVPLIQQQTPVWCWLAVSEMAIRYRNYGVSLQQCEMLAIGYYGYYDNTCCYYPSYCLITSNGWQPIMNILYYVGGNVSQWSPPPDPLELYDYLSNDFPVIAQIQSGVTSTHVVIIKGMSFQCDADGNVTTFLEVHDPLAWTGQTAEYNTFRNYWIDSLIVGF